MDSRRCQHYRHWLDVLGSLYLAYDLLGGQHDLAIVTGVGVTVNPYIYADHLPERRRGAGCDAEHGAIFQALGTRIDLHDHCLSRGKRIGNLRLISVASNNCLQVSGTRSTA